MQYKISQKKRIFITGSSGFIGKNIVERLSSEYDITAPTSKDLDLLDEDAVMAYLKENNFDTVIHCATHNATGNSTKDTTQVFKNNLRMFFNLAHNNSLYNRLFYFGSGAEYDNRHYIPKMKESYFDTYVPIDDYGFSKYISAEYSKRKPNIYNLRIFGCFGKYEDWEIRFISNALCKALYDIDITMRQNVFFDYLYIDDLCTIMQKFIQAKDLEYQEYNVCTGTTIDLVSIAKKILTVTKKNVKITIAMEGLKPEYSGDNNRLLKQFPDIQFTSIDRAIAQLYDWYTSQQSIIDPTLLLRDK